MGGHDFWPIFNKRRGSCKNSLGNVSVTQGRTIYRSQQYLPEGT